VDQLGWRSGDTSLDSFGTASAVRYPRSDARWYRNQFYFNYGAHTGGPGSVALGDAFSPDGVAEQESQGGTRAIGRALNTPDASFADVERACVQAGQGHSWDAEKHECLYEGLAPYPELPRGRGVTQEGPARQALDGSPVAGEPCQGDDVDEFGACRPQPEGEVDQDGWRVPDVKRNGYRNPYDRAAETTRRGRWERDTALDYQTADLERACRRQMHKPVVGIYYSWDAWHAHCLYRGYPTQFRDRAPRSAHPLTDGKFWDQMYVPKPPEPRTPNPEF
jgi:hypothetical protein